MTARNSTDGWWSKMIPVVPCFGVLGRMNISHIIISSLKSRRFATIGGHRGRCAFEVSTVGEDGVWWCLSGWTVKDCEAEFLGHRKSSAEAASCWINFSVSDVSGSQGVSGFWWRTRASEEAKGRDISCKASFGYCNWSDQNSMEVWVPPVGYPPKTSATKEVEVVSPIRKGCWG